MIKTVIFDFGGVLVNLDFDAALAAFERLGLNHPREHIDPYRQSGFFLSLEEGAITAGEFCDKFNAMCGTHASYGEIGDAWRAFIVGVEPYKLAALTELRRRYRVLLLSNTNPFVMEWARSGQFSPEGKPVTEYIDKLYLSYEMRMTKPSPEIFRALAQEEGLNPSEALFVDDGEKNVEAARHLGFRTLLPANGEDWREKLAVALRQ